MNNITVHTNNVPRDLIYTFELDLYRFDVDNLRNEYDWIEDEEWDCTKWFIYRGELYCVSDFMAVHNHFYNPNPPGWMKPWDGYMSFGFVGGLLIRYPRMDYNPNEFDTEHIIVGWY